MTDSLYEISGHCNTLLQSTYKPMSRKNPMIEIEKSSNIRAVSVTSILDFMLRKAEHFPGNSTYAPES
jgi:hypothetical protein